MNILVTGSSGFLAKEFNFYFSRKNNLFSVHREELLNVDTIRKNLIENQIKCILHTSWAGVGAGTPEDYEYNLQVQKNLEAVSDLVDKIFIFGSGAEFINTSLAREDHLPNLTCGTYYALAKNAISHRVKNFENFINLRLFGCFGEKENDHRFIKRSMLNIKSGGDIIINKDKEMDFFYVGDLISLIDYYIGNQSYNLPKDVNCVYNKKYKLSDIAKFLVNKYSPQVKIKILEHGCTDPYTGNSALLDTLNISFKGLHKGIEEIYS